MNDASRKREIRDARDAARSACEALRGETTPDTVRSCVVYWLPMMISLYEQEREMMTGFRNAWERASDELRVVGARLAQLEAQLATMKAVGREQTE